MNDVAKQVRPVTPRLTRLPFLTASEMTVIEDRLGPPRRLRADETVVAEGEHPGGCTIVIDGILCRHKLLPDGKRQILAFLMAGDLCDLGGALLGRMDHGVDALTAANVAKVPEAALRELLAAYPRIAEALWRQTLVDASICCEWLANVGRRSAYERIAHLLCETWSRLDAAGLASGQRFAWPITQETLGDATGLSTVHVNRVIQRLRSEGLITLGHGQVLIRDLAQLQEAGGFRPDYLYLDDVHGPGTDESASHPA